MDRVQYHLERLLPTLQLLSRLTLLSSTELQSLTHTRRHHEKALITPASSPAAFLQYVAFELDVEKLVLLRVSRAGKDPDTGNDRVTLKDRSNLRRGMEKHIISIWQRLITKKGARESHLYSLYLDFLQKRKMRRIYAQVAAQGLSMHPSEASLWIRVADWELNNNIDAAAARITLLRGIRLNMSMASLQTKTQSAKSAKHSSRRKRLRLAEGRVSTQVQAVGEDQTPRVTLSLHSSSSPSDLNILDLWVQYFKMELVFMERLRRRWAILGIGTSSAAEDRPQHPTTENGDDESEGEENVASPLQIVRQADTEEDGGMAQSTNAAAEATAPIKVLSGALPLAIFSSALALNIKAVGAENSASRLDAGPSLPAKMRLMFILAVTEGVQNFPFANLSEKGRDDGRKEGDGEALRAALLAQMTISTSALAATSPLDAGILVLTRQAASLQSLTESLDRSSRSEARLFLSEEELREESRNELAAASELRPNAQAFSTFQSPWLNRMGEAAGLLSSFQSSLLSDEETTQQVRRTQEYLLSLCFSLLRSLLDRLPVVSSPAQVQLVMAKQVKIIMDDMRSSPAKGVPLLRMKLLWTFWRLYAFFPETSDAMLIADEESVPSFSPFEVGLGARAREDPLLSYLTSSIRRAGEKRLSLSESEQQEATLLLLVFEYQATLHYQALAQEGEEENVTEKWRELLSLIVEERAKWGTTSSAALERCLVHLQARVWSSGSAWGTLLREDGSAADETNFQASGISFWSALLKLSTSSFVPPETSVSPYSRIARRTYKLFFLWCLSLSSSHPASQELINLLENAVRVSRLPLISSSSPTLEERRRDQDLHDEALYVYIVKCNGAQPAAGEATILIDTLRASPSLTVYFRLLDQDEGVEAPILTKATRTELFASLEALALKRAVSFFASTKTDRREAIKDSGGRGEGGQGERQVLLQAFRRIFRFVLGVQTDSSYMGSGPGVGVGVKRGIEVLHLAQRAGKGEERWEKEVQEVWKRVCEELAESEEIREDSASVEGDENGGSSASSSSEADSDSDPSEYD